MNRLPETCTMIPKVERPVPDGQPFGIEGLISAVQDNRPLVFLRYFDGEFHSMFDTSVRGRCNADGHQWFPESMGAELRAVFEQAAEAAKESPAIRFEMAPCWTEWPAVREYLAQLEPRQCAAFSVGRTWVDAIKSGDVFRFLTAIRWAHRRTILVGREDTKEVADILGTRHVTCPAPNAYQYLPGVVSRIRDAAEEQPFLLLSSCGMASEPLLWRLWTGAEILIDWGHTPDALMGLSPRNYLRRRGRAAEIHRQFLEWADSQ